MTPHKNIISYTRWLSSCTKCKKWFSHAEKTTWQPPKPDNWKCTECKKKKVKK